MTLWTQRGLLTNNLSSFSQGPRLDSHLFGTPSLWYWTRGLIYGPHINPADFRVYVVSLYFHYFSPVRPTLSKADNVIYFFLVQRMGIPISLRDIINYCVSVCRAGYDEFALDGTPHQSTINRFTIICAKDGANVSFGKGEVLLQTRFSYSRSIVWKWKMYSGNCIV